MKERPILFSGPMVRAILDNRKTQTRRILKPSPLPPVARWVMSDHWWIPEAINDSVKHRFITTWPDALRCPYGVPGDRLWVREAWRIGAWDETRPAFAFDYCDGPRKEWIDVPDPMCDDALFDRLWEQSVDDAEDAGIKTKADGNYHWKPGMSPCRWRPSIHMPRWASRITLEITNVRVERLQNISANDILAEGAVVRAHDDQFGHNPVSAFDGKVYMDLKSLWAAGWESINGKGSWSANPFVWVIEFRRIAIDAAIKAERGK